MLIHRRFHLRGVVLSLTSFNTLNFTDKNILKYCLAVKQWSFRWLRPRQAWQLRFFRAQNASSCFDICTASSQNKIGRLLILKFTSLFFYSYRKKKQKCCGETDLLKCRDTKIIILFFADLETTMCNNWIETLKFPSKTWPVFSRWKYANFSLVENSVFQGWRGYLMHVFLAKKALFKIFDDFFLFSNCLLHRCD